MPHDKNGNPLKAGDVVLIRARVKQVMAGEEYCNVDVETVEPMPPYEGGTTIVLNTKQVELETAPEEAPEG